MIYVRRASGLLQQFDPPELTLEGALERGWAQPEGGRLLLPLPDLGSWLKTYPVRWHDADEFGWDDSFSHRFAYGGAPWGPLEGGQ